MFDIVTKVERIAEQDESGPRLSNRGEPEAARQKAQENIVLPSLDWN